MLSGYPTKREISPADISTKSAEEREWPPLRQVNDAGSPFDSGSSLKMKNYIPNNRQKSTERIPQERYTTRGKAFTKSGRGVRKPTPTLFELNFKQFIKISG